MRFRLIYLGTHGRVRSGWFVGDPLPLLKMFWPCAFEISDLRDRNQLPTPTTERGVA